MFEYDLVGNLVAQTEPIGTLATGDPDDFVTRYGYDSVYQLIEVTNAAGEKLTYGYDSVGNVVEVTDPRKNNTTDPDDVTMSSTYDANHRVTSTIDAAGETSSTAYDLDGLVVESTDKEGSTTEIDYDPRGLVSEQCHLAYRLIKALTCTFAPNESSGARWRRLAQQAASAQVTSLLTAQSATKIHLR